MSSMERVDSVSDMERDVDVGRGGVVVVVVVVWVEKASDGVGLIVNPLIVVGEAAANSNSHAFCTILIEYCMYYSNLIYDSNNAGHKK